MVGTMGHTKEAKPLFLTLAAHNFDEHRKQSSASYVCSNEEKNGTKRMAEVRESLGKKG
jgi:hypothetical protein